MIQIAILGYGVVGSGVAEVCRMNRDIIRQRAGEDIQIKKILDIRDFPEDPYADRFTHDPADIFLDPDISVVVEAIGGAGIAYELSRQALNHHKHVVTSNKELVATFGPELMLLARTNGVSYMFEASVGGGIPIIRPLHKCLSANVIQTISGILNGTTNYILTRMEQSGIDFNTALLEAQTLGYAEQNPTADISGLDSCRKIAILSSITFSEFIDYRLIYTEGISGITAEDIVWARRLDCKIKLLGCFRRQDEQTADLIVAPMLLPRRNPIAVADDVYNAIRVEGNALGEAMFYGRGAGRLPTASAVVADVIECVMHINRVPHLVPWIKKERQIVLTHADCPVSALIRLSREISRPAIENAFAGASLDWLDDPEGCEWAVIAGNDGRLTEGALGEALKSCDGAVISRIRTFQNISQF
ncbi:MAG TPA: homoserine dehydrogenase [Clostridiales bacterium]|nr:homoserine dehydrogenase [Clostridiales bacterium]